VRALGISMFQERVIADIATTRHYPRGYIYWIWYMRDDRAVMYEKSELFSYITEGNFGLGRLIFRKFRIRRTSAKANFA